MDKKNNEWIGTINKMPFFYINYDSIDNIYVLRTFLNKTVTFNKLKKISYAKNKARYNLIKYIKKLNNKIDYFTE